MLQFLSDSCSAVSLRIFCMFVYVAGSAFWGVPVFVCCFVYDYVCVCVVCVSPFSFDLPEQGGGVREVRHESPARQQVHAFIISDLCRR